MIQSRRVRAAGRVLAAALLLLSAAAGAGAGAGAVPAPDAVGAALAAAARALCPAGPSGETPGDLPGGLPGDLPGGIDEPETLERALPGYVLTDVEDAGPPAAWLRREIRLVNGTADLALVVTGLRPGGVLRRLFIEARALGDGRPLMLALAGGDCRIQQVRTLVYEDGNAVELLVLAPDLVTVTAREPLDPPVPPGADVAGVTVAHVDSGVNYRLPQIAARLARDGAGQILGYDFWDLDPRPFDGDTGRSPFFPLRHGSEVASLLLAEAPDIRLVPLRYPRPDMARMTAVVERALAAGATIVALPMGSRRADDWTAFAAAARAHPEMLFVVSAGNDGRDIDTGEAGGGPVYPAALPLDNMIVVTSAEDDGSLAPGSNWGAASVDLLVAAEHRRVVGFDGRPTLGSGSSFAVPRVAALAARLQAAHPDWRAAALKAAIFARAVPPPARAAGSVAVGWLPEAAIKTQ